MLILGMDTSTSITSMGLIEGQKILGEVSFQASRRQLAKLIPWLEILCRECNKSKENLQAIVCVSGPGSFSGLRIGLASVQGLALGLEIPAVEICSLDVYAIEAYGENCFVMTHSQADNYFYAHYAENQRQGNIYLASLDKISKEWDDTTKVLLPYNQFKPEMPSKIHPVVVSGIKVAQMGKSRLEAGKTVAPAHLVPQYLRGSSAEEQKNDSKKP